MIKKYGLTGHQVILKLATKREAPLPTKNILPYPPNFLNRSTNKVLIYCIKEPVFYIFRLKLEMMLIYTSNPPIPAFNFLIVARRSAYNNPSSYMDGF